jgi:signal transduction histidine kinase
MSRSRLTQRNWRLASRLSLLVAVPTVAGLTLAGLRVAGETQNAAAYAQIGQLAAAGQQVTGLAQALEDERDAAAAFIAGGHQAAGLAALRRQFVITDGSAARARRLVLDLGRGYPAPVPGDAARVLASIADLPGLRERAQQVHASALTVINGYSAAITGLLPGIAEISGNSALGTTVRTLGALSSLRDQASLQQAVLGAAFADGRFGPAAQDTVTASEAQQAGDLMLFRSSATPEQSWALTRTLASPLPAQAAAVEQRAVAAGTVAAGTVRAGDDTVAAGSDAGQHWQAGMSYTVGWMRGAEQQLAGWITSYARAQRSSAIRSAVITGSLALAVLMLVVLATMLLARSLARRPRRLEAEHSEALRLAGEEEAARRGTVSVSAIFAGFLRRDSSLLEPLLRLIDDLELGEDDPERLAVLFRLDHLATRLRRNADSALVLAGEQTPRRWTEPVTLVDVVRAAVSEIEQYDRVSIEVQPPVCVAATAAVDIVHLLAELLENATTFSPAATQVTVSGRTPRGGGWVISVTDRGRGIPAETLTQLNWQLANPALADTAVAGQLGLFAVGHLAAQHGVKVTMEPSPGGGTVAEVDIPSALITSGGKPRQADEVLRIGASAVAARPVVVPLLLGAPLPAPASAESSAVTAAEPPGAETGGLPIFESVESGYPGRSSGPASADLPHRTTRLRPVPDTFAEYWPGAATPQYPPPGEPQQLEVAETTQIARTRLTSFQEGSRRARAEGRGPRDAKSVPDD